MRSSVPQTSRPRPGEEPGVVVRVFALTDVGHTRDHNEDTFLVADLETAQPVLFDSNASRELRPGEHGALFLVADGMGGAASGELASSMAGATVLEVLTESWSDSGEISPERFAAALRDATSDANERIHRFARENPEHRGMGTTATIAGLLHDHVFVAQVGDSRAYLVRDGKAIQLTKDQSLMQRLVEAGEITQEEADNSDRRNIILQALGPEPQITIDLTHQQLRRGDTLIICSDGLSGLVRADEIASTATHAPDVASICSRLVARANELGGPDNITVVAVRVDGEALDSSQADDTVGHKAFPLKGTLSEEYPVPSAADATLRSEPGPARKASITAVPANTPEAEPPVIAPIPEEIIQERKQRVAPLMWALALLAIGIAAYALYSIMSSPPKGGTPS